MLIKQKNPSLPRNVAFEAFGELLTVFSTKVTLLYLFHLTIHRYCFLHLKNADLDDSGISLPGLPSRTNLKLHNISITPKMAEEVKTNLNKSPKASGPNCILAVVPKNCELNFHKYQLNSSVCV